MSRLEDNFDAMKTDMNEIGMSIARMDAKLDASVGRLEAKMDASVGRVEAKMDASVGRLEAKFDATIPHLATKEQIARLPTRTYLWGALRVLIACIYGGFGAALAAYTALR